MIISNEKETLYTVFPENNIISILKSRPAVREGELQSCLSDGHRCRGAKLNISNLNPAVYYEGIS